MKGLALWIVGMTLGAGLAWAEPPLRPAPEPGHVGEPAGIRQNPRRGPGRARPSTNPAVKNPAVETDQAPLLDAEAAKALQEKAEADAQKLVDDFIKQSQRDQKALDEQKAALEKAVAENARATAAVDPEEVWKLFQLKWNELVPRIRALQALIQDKKMPQNILIKEIVETQLKEFTEGPWAQTAKEVAALSPQDRAQYLKQYKGWVLQAVGKVEMAEKAILWSEKYVARLDKLPAYDRVAILQPKGQPALDKWKEVALAASNDTRAALRTPPVTSLFHEKNKDILWAQPPMNALVSEQDEPDAEIRKTMNQEIRLEMVDQFLYHQQVVNGIPDKDIAAQNPKMSPKDYEDHRLRVAASHLMRNAAAHSGRVVEAIPGAGPK